MILGKNQKYFNFLETISCSFLNNIFDNIVLLQKISPNEGFWFESPTQWKFQFTSILNFSLKDLALEALYLLEFPPILCGVGMDIFWNHIFFIFFCLTNTHGFLHIKLHIKLCYQYGIIQVKSQTLLMA